MIEPILLTPASSEHVEHAGDLRPGFSRRDLAALPATTVRIQTAEALGEADWKLLREWFAAHPDVEFRVWTRFGMAPYRDLEFLKELPEIRKLSIDLVELRGFEGLDYVSSALRSLSLGETRSRAVSLRPLARFRRLQSLSLDGHQKDFESVLTLAQLQRLWLRRVTLEDVGILSPLERLSELTIVLGGTRDVSKLPRVGRLKQLTLSHIRGLADLTSLGEMESLETLRLESLKHVRRLPSLANLSRLESVCVKNLSQVEDLTPISHAPALRRLTVWEMPQVDLDSFRSFADHPALAHVHTVLGKGLRGRRLDEAVKEILPFAKTWGDDD